ncbi:succinate-semialdehyde dehydrogenase (NADP(+)) (plasmid) [Aquabacterium olei]|uniref:Succinate-semialdehyde dehydrogenase (NADP(+)) n=1 Tax=Aquabacterium olei TaxID=1296669 RepID=A0A2U8FYV0_9BURK|nr:NAD-dependent succinate-semialdehyde dehydrogenase [Aquabacterium olei]AWI55584.1 succinate-semialdehyde dehydrogenase (NADP(+)) [Aquabacterium olei]
MLTLKHPELLRQQAFFAGEWADADAHARFSVHNPANGEVLAHVPLLGEAETLRAIEAARLAWHAWRRQTAATRGKLLMRWHDLMLVHLDDLALLLTSEQGKPLAEARGEVAYAAAYIAWFAEEARRIYGETIPSPVADRQLVVTREPIGVCAAITPWNFPLAMITRKVAPALAAGNPMIVKPAEATPLSALALAQLAQEAGIPGNLLQVITGDPKVIGATLCASEVVRKLSFTGSTAVGKLLYGQCAGSVKKLSLELGGNAPFIVFDDADLDAAVQGAMASKFRNSGQTCVCANRIYVQDAVYDAFVEKLLPAVSALRVGNGTHDGVTAGPLINEAACNKVAEHVQDALQRGAALRLGGERLRGGELAQGHFFAPTVLTEVPADARVTREETFGPLAALVRFRTEEEVIALANDSPFGLASYFYSRDIGRVHRVKEALESGMVGVNTGLISTEVAPFGGMKQSGIGREGGRQGLDEYLVTKYAAVAW